MVSAKLVLVSLSSVAGAFAQTPAPSAITTEQRADILMARKMYREAIDLYSSVPEVSAERLNKVGIAYHQLMDLNDARKSYERAIKLDAHLGEARNNLGTIFYAEKRYGRAIHEYKRAQRLMPGSASVLSNLGTAYFERQDYKRATEYYSKALQLDPDVFDHHNTYGVLLQDHNVAERAKYHYYLAKMYAKEGMTDRALQCVRKSLEEGFGERKKFLEEPEFAVLRQNEEFQQILKSEPRVL